MNSFKIGLIQMNVSLDKIDNVNRAIKKIEKAKLMGADIIILPEMFNCPYDNKYFREFAEEDYGYTTNLLKETAIRNDVYIVAGSIPELCKGNVYNTTYVFNRIGNIVSKHRKVHLFDINIEDGQKFMESEVLAAGENISVFDTEFCTIGHMICYDIRFPELSRLIVDKGAKVIIVPGAFNMTTGPAHWELLFRSRALDNQVYTVGCAPARDNNSTYISYGNSIVVSPWGEVLNKLDEKEGILIQEINLDLVKKTREQLPLLKHRRFDLYELNHKE